MKIYIFNLKLLVIVGLISVFFILSACGKDFVTTPDDLPSDGKGYPRLAMWWPNTWEQPIEDLKRYDWIGFGKWDNIETVKKLKTINPNQKHFMDYSITETSWSWWEENGIVMNKIPSEWFLTQRGTLLKQQMNSNQTTAYVESVVNDNGEVLFETDDIITCDFESMKVLNVDVLNNTLTVERGFIRKANSHSQGSRIASHITFWPESWVMNMSSLCPKIDIKDGKGPQNWIEFATRNWNIKNEDLWDGFITDRVDEDQSWLVEEWCRNIDADGSNNNVTDGYAEFDYAWNEGCKSYLDYLRSVYPNKILIANSFGAFYQKLNGSLFEGFPTNWDNSRPETYDEWSERALGKQGYINVSKSGYSPNYSLTETYEDEEGPEEGDLYYDNPFEHPNFVPNYQRMRYGLSSALLGDGYFSYEINTNGHGGLGLMWFDEYDNAGKERGYLGQPINEAIIIKQVGDGSVWKREYEKGVVICNPTNVSVNVDLGGEYKLINGSQVPDINSGKLVSSINIKARDGRILLK